MVSSTRLPLYPQRKSQRYPLDGPQSQSGKRGEGKILGPTRLELPTSQLSDAYPVAIPTALSRLLIS
jgi:hypothetical protein